MKKFTFILAAATALVLASCEKKEQYAPEAAAETVVLNATLETPGTRTVLVDGTKVEWVAGDKISVFDGTDNVSAEASAGGATAQFAPALSTSGPWYAMYPYSASATISAGVISTVVPATQTAVAGTFAPELNLAVALSSGDALAFKNALGYIKFEMGCDLIQSVELTGANNEVLAGAVTVDYNGGEPTLGTAAATDAVVTIAPATGYFEKGKYYYIAVFPQTLANGFKLTYLDAFGDTHEFSTSNSATIGRSKVLNIGKVDGSSFLDEPITFACAAVKADLLAHGIGGTINTAEIYKSEAAAVTYAQMSAFDPAVPGTPYYNSQPNGLWSDPTAITSFDEFKYFVGLARTATAYRTPVLFPRCSNLTSVKLPYNITEIANYCFQNCSSLATIVFPAGLKAIYARCFQGCTLLNGSEDVSGTTYLVFPTTLTNISTMAFKDCSSLEKVYNAGNTIETIGLDAFSNCSKMSFSSRVFASLKDVKRGAFLGTKVTGLNFSAGTVTEIPDSLFYGVSALTTIIHNDKITKIGKFAFYNCTKLDRFSMSNSGKLDVPGTCSTIDNYAFSNCRALGANGVDIAEGVTTLGNRVFRYMIKMKTITLPSTLTTMSYGCFSGHASYLMDIDCITVKATTPPTIKGTSTYPASLCEDTSLCTIKSIKVPAASVDAYKAADGWSQFKSVISAIE